MMMRQTFSFKQARQFAGLTQDDMAKRLNIHRSTYQKLEHDASRATVAQVQEISRITGIPIASLFFGVDSTLVEFSEEESSAQ